MGTKCIFGNLTGQQWEKMDEEEMKAKHEWVKEEEKKAKNKTRKSITISKTKKAS